MFTGKRDRSGSSADSPRENQGGFTLLELLISVVLVLSVVLIASAAMRLGQRSIASGDRKVEHLERLRATVTLLDSQIQSAAPLTYEEDGNELYHFRGNADMLQVATNCSLWGVEQGYVLATYRVERNSDGKMSLLLTEKIVGTERTREAKLLDGIDELSFAFFRKGQTAEEGAWEEDWRDGTDMPRKVRIRVIAGMVSMAMVIPLRSTGSLAPTGWSRGQGKL